MRNNDADRRADSPEAGPVPHVVTRTRPATPDAGMVSPTKSAAIGFAISNNVLIIAGTLDGGSGLIVSIII